jgi:DNA-binding transcriptional LysR family regulator
MFSSVELREIRVFLTLAEELHYGRAAERLLITPARVSQTIQTLEAKLDGRLFERTSRRVALTALGVRLDAELRPSHTQLMAVLEAAAESTGTIAGILRVGVTATTDCPAIVRMVDAFAQHHPECETTIERVDVFNPFTPLRTGEIEVLCNWLAIDDQPDLKAGPVIERRDRCLAVAISHPLAARASVSIEDLAEERVQELPETFPRALGDAIVPRRTPTGRPIPRAKIAFKSLPEFAAWIARGKIVAPTVKGTTIYARDDVVLIPIRDMPPLPLGLIWSSAHETPRIRALADLVRGLDPGRGEPRSRHTVAGATSDGRQPV